jgi:hypothetical protein
MYDDLSKIDKFVLGSYDLKVEGENTKSTATSGRRTNPMNTLGDQQYLFP